MTAQSGVHVIDHEAMNDSKSKFSKSKIENYFFTAS